VTSAQAEERQDGDDDDDGADEPDQIVHGRILLKLSRCDNPEPKPGFRAS
jgi:hypothetical protein